MSGFSNEQLEQLKNTNAFFSHIIGDYNAEGFDSVESEDFDPGFGCVPAVDNKPIALPPDITPDIIKKLAFKKVFSKRGEIIRSQWMVKYLELKEKGFYQ